MTRGKRLMLLGGSVYLMPAIEAAHRLGADVITCDYLPDNFAHRFADLYCNISVVDRDAVLKKAQELKIDGILGFANDAGVLPAAYVAEKMGLPTPAFRAVEILQNKDLFRDYLSGHGFNCPWHCGYSDKAAALKDEFPFPVIVKPVDSCGSKGVTVVRRGEDLSQAIDAAVARSLSGRFIVEQYLELVGHQSGSDSFSVDNELVFCSYDSQYFDPTAENPVTPVAHVWPSDFSSSVTRELTAETQRLIRQLNLGSTNYNIEARVATDGKPYLMEVSPRTGGNRLSEVLKLATGQDMIENGVRVALGMKPIPMTAPVYDGAWAVYVIHAPGPGVFRGVRIDPAFAARHVRDLTLYCSPGAEVAGFSGANQALGTVFLRFESREEAVAAIENAAQWLELREG